MALALACWLALVAPACGTDVQLLVNNGQLTLRVSVNREELVLVIGGPPEAVAVTLVRRGESGPVNLSLSGLPAGVTTTIRHPGITNTGSVTFQATTSARPASGIEVTIIASDGSFFDSATVDLTLVL